MASTILLVDDQRDILRLLHSTLDTLKNNELEIIEAQSGEEALLEAGFQKIDLLITDYLLPGINGVELMHKMRVRNPEARVVLISGVSDRKARDEMLNAGANAIFDKPIPLADFLDKVELILGLVRTIFPTDPGSKTESQRLSISNLLANFRQDIKARAVFLVNERGLVVERAGDLLDSSLEVSLLSALSAIIGAALKVAKINRQDVLNQYSIFPGGDQDLVLFPVDVSYSLLLAGNGFAKRETLHDTVEALLTLRNEIGKSLRSMDATDEQPDSGEASPFASMEKAKPSDLPLSPGLEALLREAGTKKLNPKEVDAFWQQATEKSENKDPKPEGISYKEARKRGLTPRVN